MRIDAHQHFWKYSPSRDTWITEEMAVLKRDFLPEDLRPNLEDFGFEGTVAVQADQSTAETDFLVALAQEHPWIRAVVGWADLCAPSLPDYLAGVPGVVTGFRHIVQAEPKGFLLSRDFIRGVNTLGQAGFIYELLIYPHQMPEALDFLAETENTTIVLDHLAKPAIRSGLKTAWELDLAAMAHFPNLYAKLSGLITEAGRSHWNRERLFPYLDEALEVFGPTRLMYGSDWPVCLLEGSYAEQWQLVADYISQLSAAEQSAILGENANRIYLRHGSRL